ncbi:MAG: 1-acyl-sn-glycerol-3-phosphate acyltransferase [Motiliproteus sp.]|nr:1-acyl-sn-glycerol-3-phosphate acyltransferase [Motiliproteus sp.]MCW9052331.1 1-acyl-sn-glycerol-3-phosphate acyltransferase [Motiliproteus sp.]
MIKLRSALFSAISLLATVIYSLICLVFFSFLPFKQRFAAVVTLNRIVLWLARVICGVKCEVEGLENLPTSGSYVVLANHQSEWETFYLQLMISPLCTVLKKELLKIPFFGWGLALLNPIAIDRAERSGAMKQILKQGKARLKEGTPVLIFPQGTRVKVGEIGRFNKGGAMLACSAKVPVVPIVHNGGSHWPSKTYLKNPGTIQVKVGRPIETEGKTVDEVHQLSKGWLEQGMRGLGQIPETASEENKKAAQ